MPENSPEPPREELLAAAEVAPRVAEEASPRPRGRPRKRGPPANRAAPRYHKRVGPRRRANTLRPVLRKLCRGVQESQERANPPQPRQERQISHEPQRPRSPSRPNSERRAPGNNKINSNNFHGQVDQPRRPENSIFGNGPAFVPDHAHAVPNKPPTPFPTLEAETLDEIHATNTANNNDATSKDHPEAAYQTPASLTTPSASSADMASVRATTMNLARVIDKIELSPGGNHLTFSNDNRRQEETLREDQAEQPQVDEESRLLEEMIAPWVHGENSG